MHEKNFFPNFKTTRGDFLRFITLGGPIMLAGLLSGCNNGPKTIQIQAGDSLRKLFAHRYHENDSYDKQIKQAFKPIYQKSPESIATSFLDSEEKRFNFILWVYLQILPHHNSLQVGDLLYPDDLEAIVQEICDYPLYRHQRHINNSGQTQSPINNHNASTLDTKQAIQSVVSYAQEEMRLSGIPASITLAQRCLESNYGQSILAAQHNYFGIKCHDTSHIGKHSHCSEYRDDYPNDRFIKYPDIQSGFLAHSQLLQKERYYPLQQSNAGGFYNHCKRYYKGDSFIHLSIRPICMRQAIQHRDIIEQRYARGLRALGYATDPLYASALLSYIHKHNLTQYDIV